MKSVLLSVAVLLFGVAAIAAGPGASATYAQSNADIYAAADLLPEGTPEGPGSGLRGSATFERMDNGMTRVTVTFTGLAPNSAHANHVHDGGCTGSILYPLEVLQADASGMARAVTELEASVEFERWYVNVHESATLPSPGIACGKVTPALAGSPPPPVAPPAGGGEVPGMPVTGISDQVSALSVLILAIFSLFVVMGLCLRVAGGRRA
jgi:hypothetical protein